MIGNTSRLRTVVLCNNDAHTRATAVTLLDAGIQLAGVLSADLAADSHRYRRVLRRNGVIRTASKALARTVYRLGNSAQDIALYRQIFRPEYVERRLAEWGGPQRTCVKYSEEATLAWLNDIAPDIIVVHSASWVTKSIRSVPRSGIVLGGHPGLTEHFRGGYSSFWALATGQPEKIGWTVFLLDAGVDSGDIISQGRIEPQPGDSFETLDWRLMTKLAADQARIITSLSNGEILPRRKNRNLSEKTLFGYPTLMEYLKYKRAQSWAR